MDWKVFMAAPAAVLLMAAANPAFEQPKGWGSSSTGKGPDSYRIGIDPNSAYLGSRTLAVQSTEPVDEFDHGAATIWASGYAGKRVRLSGFFRTEGVKQWAGVFVETCDQPRCTSYIGPQLMLKPSDLPFVAGTTGTPTAPRDSSGWQPFAITVDVPAANGDVMMGPLVRGEGRVWVSQMRFDEVGPAVPTSTERLPLDVQAFNARFVRQASTPKAPQPPRNLDLL